MANWLVVALRRALYPGFAFHVYAALDSFGQMVHSIRPAKDRNIIIISNTAQNQAKLIYQSIYRDEVKLLIKIDKITKDALTRLFLYMRFISNAVNLGLAFRSPLLPPSVLMLPIDPH